MAKQNPFDLTQFTELFDPSKFAEFFSPDANKSLLSVYQIDDGEVAKLLNSQGERVTALIEANHKAAEGYRKLMKRQGEILKKLMSEAGNTATQLDLSSSPNAHARNMETYTKAFETATDLMRQLSEETQAAAEEVYKDISDRAQKALKHL